MSSIEDIRRERLEKRGVLQKEPGGAYPGGAGRTHRISEIQERFDELASGEKEVVLAGRIRGLRSHGGSTFLHVEDVSGRIQAYVKRDRMGETAYRIFLDRIDLGDIIQLRGVLFVTQKGERTLLVAHASMLAKSIRPLPDKWHGLQDEEERYRKRYLDLLFSPDVKEKFVKRAAIAKAVREFLDMEGFLEVETPVLQSIYGGAEAEPFTTHLNAFDMDMYLRISLELPLKRLMVGGFEKVYEMGRIFRNEGVDRQHSPEFTMLEFYWAYADYKDMMRMTERLFSFVLEKVLGTSKIMYEGRELDFTPPWPRVEYADLLSKHLQINIEEWNRDALVAKAKELGIETKESMSKGRVIDTIYKKAIRPKLVDPQFVIHHPSEMFPLAKQHLQNPEVAESVQLLVAGVEVVKAYSEQNDPVAQRKAFEEQEGLFRQGLEDAQRMDTDFVEALEYGMPPTAGFGMGMDRLAALLTDSHSVREITLFPVMRPKK